MSFEFTPYAVPLWVGNIILLGVMVLAWRRRSTRGAPEFLALSFFIEVYSLAYSFEMSSLRASDVLTWLKIEYIGVTFGPVMMLAVALHYTNYHRMLTPVFYALFSIVPLTTLAFAWTNENHELIWQNIRLERTDGFTRTIFERGGWYMVQIVFWYTMSIFAITLLFHGYRKATGVYRQQQLILLVALLIPFGTHLIYIAEITPEGLDVNTYALILTALMFAWGILDYRLLDIMPVAREAVLRGMSEAVIVVDSNNQVVYLNPMAQQLAGVTAEASVGRPAVEVFAKWAYIVRDYWAAGQARAEVEAEVLNGRHVFDMQLSTLRTNRGGQQGRLLVLRDITERKAIETEAKEKNQQLTALRQFETDLARKLDLPYVLQTTIDAAVTIAKPDMVAIGLLADTEDTLQMAALWVGGSTIGPAPNVSLPIDKEALALTMTNRHPLLFKQGSVKAAEIIISPKTQVSLLVPLFSAEKFIGILRLESENADKFSADMVNMLHLLTPRIAMAIDNARVYEDHQKLIAELEAFAHTVAHDLKNPLSSISSAAELVQSPIDMPPERREQVLGGIGRNANKATEIINGLLVLAGVRTTTHIEIAPLNMQTIVDDVCQQFDREIQQRTATLKMPKTWPSVLGYSLWVEEIWANYLSNALKYGNQPPTIEFGCDALANGNIRFWVKDNGPGLTDEEQAKLFRPFTRLQSAGVAGHGLGLSIVQRIAERLNGEVGVQSTIGQGSQFYFTLPAAPQIL